MKDDEDLEELEAIEEGQDPRKGMSEIDIEIEKRRFQDFLPSASLSRRKIEEGKQLSENMRSLEKGVADLHQDWNSLIKSFYAFEKHTNRILGRRDLNKKEQLKLSCLEEEFRRIKKVVKTLNNEVYKGDRYFQLHGPLVFLEHGMVRDLPSEYMWRDYDFENRLKRLSSWKEIRNGEIEEL